MGARRIREAALHEVLQAAKHSPKLLLLTRCPRYLAQLRRLSSGSGSPLRCQRRHVHQAKGLGRATAGPQKLPARGWGSSGRAGGSLCLFHAGNCPQNCSLVCKQEKRRVLFWRNKGRTWRQHRMNKQRSDRAVHRHWDSKSRWLPSRKAAESNHWYSLFVWTSQPEQEAWFLQFIWDKHCCLQLSFKGTCKGTNTQPLTCQQTLWPWRKWWKRHRSLAKCPCFFAFTSFFSENSDKQRVWRHNWVFNKSREVRQRCESL